jgi:hypothetical protein
MSHRGNAVSRPQLINRVHDFWRDFNTVEHWRFPELPPCYLLHAMDLPYNTVDQDELVRARWMWNRRPKPLVGDHTSTYVVFVLLALLLLLIPRLGILLALVWCAAIASAVAKEAVRMKRWRRQYESSIARVIRSRRSSKR